MIYPNDSRILITQDMERLAILDVDSWCRVARILISVPMISLGLLLLYVVFSGAGMAEAVGFWQSGSKMLFLGIIGILFGLIPLWIGLRIWFIREEIVIYASGGLDRCFVIGRVRFCRISWQDVTSGSFRIDTRRGTKTGTSHELIARSDDEDAELRLLSFKARADAELWLQRIRHHLVPDFPLNQEAEQNGTSNAG